MQSVCLTPNVAEVEPLRATVLGFLDPVTEEGAAWRQAVDALDPCIASFDDIPRLIEDSPSLIGQMYVFGILQGRIWLTHLGDCSERVRAKWNNAEPLKAAMLVAVGRLNQEDSGVMFDLDLTSNPIIETRQHLVELFNSTPSALVQAYLSGIIYFRVMMAATTGKEFV